jgi:hypothetical protein
MLEATSHSQSTEELRKLKYWQAIKIAYAEFLSENDLRPTDDTAAQFARERTREGAETFLGHTDEEIIQGFTGRSSGTARTSGVSRTVGSSV